MTLSRLRPEGKHPTPADTECFERLFRDHYAAVLAYALARASADLAKDAAAQTFLVAWRRRHEIPQAPRGWLLGVARRSLADLRRARNRQIALGTRVYLLADVDVSADDAAEFVTERDAVHSALARLSSADAEVLRLISWDGLSYREAAESLGCSTATFAVRLHRARRRFEQIFGQGSPDLPLAAASQPSSVIPSAEAMIKEAR